MHIAKLKRPLLIIVVLLLLVSSSMTIWLNLNNSSSAADARNFNAGNIMSDFVMTNKSSMSEAQIQAFLTSKNSCSDRNIGKATQYPNLQYSIQNGKFVCLAEESFNGESAARIIWQAAQDYNINPQVLIVLLEKEQGLVTDTWPNNIQYRSATGYGCPDTADCNGQYFGFKNQVRNAANFFRAYQTGNTGWWKTVWPGNSYIGTWQPFNYNLQYHPNASCGTISTYIENRATASLYSYTPYRPNQASLNAQIGTGDSCSSYGNRNFWMFFNNWFGSTIGVSAETCDSKVGGVTCIWSARKSDGSQFLTRHKSEIESAVSNFGWLYEGIAFYAAPSQANNSVPVKRLRSNSIHHYTSDQSEYTSLVQSGEWTDEGVAFYSPPTTASLNNSAHQVYRLFNPAKNHRYWTGNASQRNSLLNAGYTVESNVFSSYSGKVSVPTPPQDRNNIYQLDNGANHLYSTNLAEIESALNSGYQHSRVLTTTNRDNSGTPIYRLRLGATRLYTSSAGERDNAISKHGYVSEGIGFYLDNDSDQVYRLFNTQNNAYLYTTDVNELMSRTNTAGWRYEGVLINTMAQDDVRPVYRFLNRFNDRHFYTINLDEALKITNKDWIYETIAFRANRSSGLPIYRLRLNDKHFYTASSSERDLAINKYGYLSEDIAFYASQTPTEKLVYRLQGGPDEYFYTASSQEKDSAVSRYGYRYEGIGFYLP